MRLNRTTKSPAKKKKPKEEEDIEVIGGELAEERLSSLEEALASAEARIRDLQSTIDTTADERVREKIRNTYEGFECFFAAAEMRITSRILEFFEANPFWEFKEVSIVTEGAEFYNPKNWFQKLLNQGWRFVGHGYNGKDRYDYFIRPKDVKIEQNALAQAYKDVLEKRAKEEKEQNKKLSEGQKPKGLKLLKK